MKLVVPILLILTCLTVVAYFVTELQVSQALEITVQSKQLNMNPDNLAWGAQVYFTRGCAECHGVDGGGKIFIDDKYYGRFVGSNLTKGQGGVGANYPTGRDWERAVRYGLNPKFRTLTNMPANEYYPLTPRDSIALYSYLAALRPVDRTLPPNSAGPISRILYLFGQFPELYASQLVEAGRPQAPDMVPSASPEYGKYLAISCARCHGENMRGIRNLKTELPWKMTPNITSGGVLVQYDLERFKLAMRAGVTPDGRHMTPGVNSGAMPWESSARFQEYELAAIFAYLKTL